MRMQIDRERCVGSGACTLQAPGVFDQSDEDGLVVLLEPVPGPADRAEALAAVGTCPAEAISVEGDQ